MRNCTFLMNTFIRMKNSILFLVASASLSVMAQSYQPLITPGKQSVFFFDCSFCPVGVSFCNHYYFNGDTTIGGITYTKLYANRGATVSQNAYTYLAALLREDTAKQIVYKYAGLPQDTVLGAAFGSEVEFWNYTKAIGDSVLLFNTMFPSLAWRVIAQIDTITLYNQQKVRQYIDNYSEVLFTEGILYSNYAIDNFGPSLYPDFCRAYTGYNVLLYTHAASSCPLDYINVLENSEIQLSVLPNPASELIVLTTPVSGDFILYDVLGKLVLQASISAQEQKTIVLPNLPEGMYVWIFRTDRGLEKGKLLIYR